MKGCGKSAPRRRRRRRHGKPHREQDQVGTTAPFAARRWAQAGFRAGRPGRSREARGDAGPRGMAIPRPRARTEPGLQAACALAPLAHATGNRAWASRDRADFIPLSPGLIHRSVPDRRFFRHCLRLAKSPAISLDRGPSLAIACGSLKGAEFRLHVAVLPKSVTGYLETRSAGSARRGQ